jgi:DeoR/GlpR family transcriptional regulator of sugar metabolism
MFTNESEINQFLPVSFRQRKIIEIISQKGFDTVEALSGETNCSAATIRRELNTLSKAGLLQRVTGGAKANPQSIPITKPETISAIEEKKRIGVAAAALISDYETIGINSGTTAMTLANNLLDKHGLTVVTAHLEIAEFLSRKSDFEVILLGGRVQSGVPAVVGDYALEMIRSFVFDKVFIGVVALNPEHGLMTNFLEQAAISRVMIESARKTIVIVDSSKFYKQSGASIAPFNKIDILITDDKVKNDPALYKKLETTGVDIRLV